MIQFPAKISAYRSHGKYNKNEEIVMGNRRNMKKSQASYARECLYLACQVVGAHMQMKREGSQWQILAAGIC